jgi:hypothetical protein
MLETLLYDADSFQCYGLSSMIQIYFNASDSPLMYRSLQMIRNLLHRTDSFNCYSLPSNVQIPSSAVGSLQPHSFKFHRLSSNGQNGTDYLPHCRSLPMLQALLQRTDSFMCNRLSSTIQIPFNATGTPQMYRFLLVLQALLLLYKFLSCYRLSSDVQIHYKTADTPPIFPDLLLTHLRGTDSLEC